MVTNYRWWHELLEREKAKMREKKMRAFEIIIDPKIVGHNCAPRAEGVQFSDGRVVVWWKAEGDKLEIFPDRKGINAKCEKTNYMMRWVEAASVLDDCEIFNVFRDRDMPDRYLFVGSAPLDLGNRLAQLMKGPKCDD